MSAAGLKTFEQLYQAPNFNLQPVQNSVAASALDNNNVDNKGLEKGDTFTFAGKEISKKKAVAGIAGFTALTAFIVLCLSRGKKPAENIIPNTNSIEAINADIRINTTGNLVNRVNNMLRNIEETKDRANDFLKRAEKYLKTAMEADLSSITPDKYGKKILIQNKKKHIVTSTFVPAGKDRYNLVQIQTSKLNATESSKFFMVDIQDGKITSCRIQNRPDTALGLENKKGKELKINKNGFVYEENGSILEVVNGLPKAYYGNTKSTNVEEYALPGNKMSARTTKYKLGPFVEFDNNGKVISFADGVKKIKLDIFEESGLSAASEEHMHAKYFFKMNNAGELVQTDEAELTDFVNSLLQKIST